MIIRIEDLKLMCSKILSSIDKSEVSEITDVLQLTIRDKNLYMCVSNHKYYVEVMFNLNEDISFDATVNAKKFLDLISKTTSETVELTVSDGVLFVRGNSKTKFPMIYDGDELFNVEKIEINNVTTSFNVGSKILNSIATYNAKELKAGIITRPIQNLFYIDQNGAVTFTGGACVNNFSLDKPVSVLLPQNVVNLFKLFSDDTIEFEMGFDSSSSGTIQPKVMFKDSTTTVVSILPPQDSLMSTFPISAIRSTAENTYPYSTNINRIAFLDALKRLAVFTDKSKSPWCMMRFIDDSFTVKDSNNQTEESIFYDGNTKLDGCNYTATVVLSYLMSTLESCSEPYITLSFGDGRALVVNRGNITNIIPEMED